METLKISNKEMQEFCDESESYCPIDSNGNLQSEVNDDTAYIVDIGADEQEKHHSESKNEMMVVFDREGSNFYKITVAPWW